MQFWEIIGIFICVLAVVGFYTLACLVARCLSIKDKIAVGVRVRVDDDLETLQQKLSFTRLAVSSDVGFEEKPILLLDPSVCPGELCRDLYIEFGDFDIFVKMKSPLEED